MKRFSSAQWILPVLIVLLAVWLRFYQLGDKGLWGDEIAQAKWSLLPLAKMWARFRDPPDFILHFLLGQLAQQFGASAFWVRLPSAITSVLAAPATYVVARRVGSRTVALVAMLLVAVSPFQIWYAQDARLYAALACYAALSLYFFLRMLDCPQWRTALGLTVMNALAVYTHLFGVMPLLIEGIALVGVALGALWHARAQRTREKLLRVLLPRAHLLILASFALTALAALPLVPGTLPYVLHPSLKGIEAEFSYAPFQLTPDFLQLLLSDMGLAPDLGWRTVLSLALALLGLIALWKNNSRGAWILGAWLLLPLLLLHVAHPSRGVANRYLIFLQPVFVVLIAIGLMWLGEKIVTFRREIRVGAIVVGIVIMIFVVVPPLQALYPRAKLNDWQTLARFFATHAQPGDVLMGENKYWALNALAYYLPNVNAYSSPPGTLDALQNARAQNRRLWYVSFGGGLNPEVEQWVQANFTRVEDAAWMRADLDYVPRDEFHFTQSEGLVALYFHDGEIPSRIEYANELGDRANVTPHLPLAFGEMLEAKLELAGGEERGFEIIYSSKKPAQFQVTVNGESWTKVNKDIAGNVIVTRRGTLGVEGEQVFIQVKNLSRESPLFVKSIRLSSH
ncbi:MAG: glycosyltransferase family 39 protein [Chloroflexi bacterium]|nr:glycosyltransferase family 39 protein [Chloroflexota bacterium]